MGVGREEYAMGNCGGRKSLDQRFSPNKHIKTTGAAMSSRGMLSQLIHTRARLNIDKCQHSCLQDTDGAWHRAT